MTRINFFLFLTVLMSALYLVYVQYESRRLFTELDRAELEARKLDAERERLELEKRRQATAQRVEQLARDKLQMRAATPSITDYVTLGNDGKALAVEAGTSRSMVQGHVSGVNLPRDIANKVQADKSQADKAKAGGTP
jgi:cell division protein FtsL